MIPLTEELTEEEKDYIYEQVIKIDPIFEEKWEREDDWVFNTQRLKVLQNYEAYSRHPKSRKAFIARIIEYTANGGVSRLFEEW